VSRPTLDYTHKDAAALTQALLNVAREKLPLWTDHSANDLGVALLESVAYLGDLLLYYQDRIANESYLETATEPRSVLQLLRLIGYELEPSKPASADLFLLFDLDRPPPRPMTLPTGAEFHTTRETAGEVIRFRYLGPPLTLEIGTTAAPGPNVDVFDLEADGKRYLRWGVNELLPVRQVEREVNGERLGSSDGSPGQRFVLAHAPVIDDTLEIVVRAGSTESRWQRVETLLFSEPTDRHYQVRRDENERVSIEFGTGVQGIVPPWGVDNILASYLVGGGARGNVAPNTIVKPGRHADSIPGLRRSGHLERGSGGADREPLAVAAQRGPRQFRSQGRAVTAADYEAHALEFGVAKARAFMGAWNRVRLLVAPAGGGLPSKTLKEQLLHYLDQRRVITTVVEVKDPRYVPVTIVAELEIEPTYFRQQVRHAADVAVRALFAFDAIDFGQVVYLSKLYEAVEAIDGVRGVVINEFSKPDQTPDLPNRGTLVFAPEELPVLLPDTVRWTVTGGLLG
jgi:Baseplate J-like protein